MPLTRKHLLVIGGVTTVLAIALVVGVTVGVITARRKPAPPTVEQRVHRLLENNPLIDG